MKTNGFVSPRGQKCRRQEAFSCLLRPKVSVKCFFKVVYLSLAGGEVITLLLSLIQGGEDVVVLCLIGGYFSEVKLGFHLGEPYVWLGRPEGV